MTDTRCALIHLDRAAGVLATTSIAGNDHAALRRAQALAASTPVGIAISREILAAKLGGQAAVAAMLDANAGASITDRQRSLEHCSDLAALRLAESQAAIDYWAAWRGIHVSFTPRDAIRVPAHWTRFTQRVSPLTGSPRVAVDPTNAITNFLYALLEAETRIALTTVGLDPGIGILHIDQPARDSLALDLMEAARHAVDHYLLALVSQRTFTAHDFLETANGQCRLVPGLASELAATTFSWAGEIAPHAQHAARLLAHAAGLPPPPTQLTGQRRRAARPSEHKTRPFRAAWAPVGRTCQDCGSPMTGALKSDAAARLANIPRGAKTSATRSLPASARSGPPAAKPQLVGSPARVRSFAGLFFPGSSA
jgi:CRISPR-associated endonuclease Cas1